MQHKGFKTLHLHRPMVNNEGNGTMAGNSEKGTVCLKCTKENIATSFHFLTPAPPHHPPATNKYTIALTIVFAVEIVSFVPIWMCLR